ncbi:PAS domain-containing sensor histidine kinase [Mucilaginibacter rubeus]|uniref:PAS domain-containing sensor histidine kinase n=1 Tax=Mucilaginibacter rubeus TaxID=2027860 RepID=UPI001AA0F759|nr:PAS domain-containing sensor histidine kinase [Mucilaginibacter rubeus]QTE56104.1 PAS domain-containing sensor histidine kinase [Mucilaginibacter rubeus]QTF63192.1 PAS domain-containing sensor histidine kinase [Mucilaginibacter rubeus]
MNKERIKLGSANKMADSASDKDEKAMGLFMSAPGSVLIRRGPELSLTFINDTALYQTGLTRADIIGKNIDDTLKKMNSSFDPALFRNVYKTGNPFSARAFHIRHDLQGKGEIADTWYDLVIEPIFDLEGRVDGVATFSHDVTELIKANNELLRKQNRFALIADAIPHKIWTSGPDGKATYYNKGWYDYTGASELEQLRQLIWGALHPDDLKPAMDTWEKALKNGEDVEIEQRFKRFDGAYLWHLTRVCACKDETGSVTMWVGSSTNIHEQKCAEEALRESEAQFKALTNSNSLLIWQTDEHGTTTFVNDTWRAYTGVEKDAIDKNEWLNNIHPDDRIHALQQFNDAFNARLLIHSKYRFLDVRTGQYRWMLDNAHPVFNPEFGGYIGSMTDIQEQEMAQLATNLLMEKKDEFLSIASHELKTPITSMKASLQILYKQGYMENMHWEKALPMITLANRQVNKLTHIVDDLLEVTGIQAGNIQLNKTSYVFIDSLKECIQQIEQQVPDYDIVVDNGTDAVITADRVRIEQVLGKLLSNAVKYSPNKPKIIVRVIADKKFLKCSVTDFGIGIPDDQQPFIFDRFFRVHGSSQNFAGLGLGLFIAAEVIKQHNGYIGFNSKENEGSTFWFSLPLSTK